MSHRNGLRVALALALGLAAFTSMPNAQASVVQALELRGMVEEADRVLLGQVVSQASRYDDRGRIVTDVQMQVEEALKGEEAPGEMVVVRHLGGVVDGIGMRVHGEPSFEPGEGVLLFGRKLPRLNLLRPVGMAQGAVHVFREKGVRWARAAALGVTAVRRGENGTLTKSAPPLSSAEKLDDVLKRVRSIVAEQAR